MSILIPDMEMPKSCNDCRFAVDGWCYAYPKQANGDALNKRIRPDWCPMIQVVDTTPRCPHCGGKIERRKNEWYCYSCHFWWEAEDETHHA